MSSRLFPRRRDLLAGAALTAGAGLLPRRAPAAGVSAADRKFLFVFAGGGWDPTRVLADGFDIEGVDMEGGAERAEAGGIAYVDHPDRPSVRTFFEAWHDRSVILNGVLVRAIAHEICTMISMTGTTSGLVPDWPAILGAAAGEAVVLPHLVMAGPSFPGNLAEAVVRAGQNGQLDALLNGGIADWSDQANTPLGAPGQSLIDNYVRRRASARRDGAVGSLDRELASAFSKAIEKATDLKDLRYVMSFSGGSDLASVGAVAVEALSTGLCRCATLASPVSYAGEWDTHADNDALQTGLWESLFSGLSSILARLDITAGTASPSLLDETIVVVLSEMGRTPALNGLNGKDHWPYTSVLLVGGPLQGDRVIGGWDANWYGLPVDPASGDVAEEGQILSSEAVGATLLALGDVDPADHVSGVEPLALEG